MTHFNRKTLSRRKNFSIKQKEFFIEQYQRSGMTLRSFSKAQGIPGPTLHGWIKREHDFKTKKNKKTFKLSGRKKEILFHKLELELFIWIRDRNTRGLKVKDKYIQMQMGEIRRKEIEELQKMNLDNHIYLDQVQNFRISKGWLSRFKSRYNLVSRRVTTTRSLPDGYEAICKQFLEETQQLIASKSIAPAQIVNFDQVPRYFELESQSTITVMIY